MALTRAKITNVDSSQNYFTDPMTVLRQGATSANVDVGFLFNRAHGLVSNVALYWSESGNTFVTAFTSNTGVNNGNILVSSYTNLATGALSVTGTGSFTGNLTTGHILPSANITYDIGSPTLRFRTLYISGNTIDMGGATITTDTTSGGFAFVPKPTSANPNPLGTVFSPTGAITTINTTGGVIAAGAINTSINNNQGTANFGNVQINSNVSSTSTTTGALVVSGGAGISGNLYVGGVYIGSGGTNGLFWAANNAAVSTGGGASSGSENAYIRTSFTATANQTTFSAVYTAGYIQVYANGVLLNAEDYTATNGSTVVLNTGRVAGDIVETVAFSVVVASGYSANTIVYSNAAGYLTSSNSLTYDGTTVTATKFAGALNGTVGATTPSTVVATSVTNSGLTSGRVTYASTGGLLVDSANLVFTGTSVGIGTTNPTQLLTVNGAAGNPATSGSTQNGITRLSNTTDNGVLDIGIKSGGTGAWLQSTDGGASGMANQYPLLLNPVGGSVGIGTSSPGYRLHIVGSGASATARIESTSNTNSQLSFVNTSTSGVGFVVGLNGDSSGNGILYHQDAKDIQIYTNTTERMRITSAGLVGIGTSSPTDSFSFGNALDVNGSTGAYVYVRNNGSATNVGGIGYSGSDLYITNKAAGNIRFFCNADATERMRIDSSGNVGINATPSNYVDYVTLALNDTTGSLIELKANGTANGELVSDNNGFMVKTVSSTPLRFGTDNTERMRIDSSGNVGIGTTSPVSLLTLKQTVAGGLGAELRLINGNTTVGTATQIAFATTTTDSANSAAIQVVRTAGGADFRFFSDAVERMRIDSYGELLIGATTQGRETNLAVVGTYQDPVGAWAQVGIYSNDSYAINKGGTLMFGGQDGLNVRSYFAAIKGAKSTATSSDYSGYLAFYTRPVGDVPAERMRIDSSGNLGLGVTPSAWGTTAYIAMQLPNGGSLSGYKGSVAPIIHLSSNLYYDDTNDRYVINGAATRYSQNQGVHSWSNAASGTAGNIITFTQAMTLDASGNLGIGTTSPAFKTEIVGGATTVETTLFQIRSDAGGIGTGSTIAFANSTNTTAGSGRVELAALRTTSSGASFVIRTGDNSGTIQERMRIDSSGNLLLGTASQFGFGTGKLVIEQSAATFVATMQNSNAIPYGMYIKYSVAAPNNSSNEFIYCHDGTLRFSVMSNGGISNYSGNNVNLSDRREKTNFAPAKSYLDVICAIPIQTFNYIDQNLEEDGGLTLGVVAQDVQAVAPELVMESNKGTKEEPKMRLSIYQTDLQYALMKCIQEQQVIIESLTTRLTVLENK